MARVFIWSLCAVGLAAALLAADIPQLAPVKAALPEPVRKLLDDGRSRLATMADALPEPVRKLIGPRLSAEAQGAAKGAAKTAVATPGPAQVVVPLEQSLAPHRSTDLKFQSFRISHRGCRFRIP